MIDDKALVNNLTRKEAISLASFMELLTLSARQLAKETEMALAEQDKETMPDPLINQHIRKNLSYEFGHFTNAYLSSFLTRSLGRPFKIVGRMPKLEPCPCCGYRTGKNEIGDICKVCFWEYDGVGPNGMSIKQAKANFAEFGAMEMRFLEYLHPDRMSRYEK